MLNYNLVPPIPATGGNPFIHREIIPRLTDMWAEDYRRQHAGSLLLVIDLAHCSYLFDQAASRLVAAWAISKGKVVSERDQSRMRGFPKKEDSSFHRGHVIPHQMGGGLDINLVIQFGKLNIGQFKVLENKATAQPGSLYFTYWKYNDKLSQKPFSVEQGLLPPGKTI